MRTGASGRKSLVSDDRPEKNGVLNMKFSLDEILTVIDKVKETELASFTYQDADTKIKIGGSQRGMIPAAMPVMESGNYPGMPVMTVHPGMVNQMASAGVPGIMNSTVQERMCGSINLTAQEGMSGTTNPVTQTENPGTESAASSQEDKYVTIESPMVGTFYAAPSEDGDPFVKVGDEIAKGQPVCIVEAMKLMNEIEAETDGTVAEILVTNGQMVEFGQPLMKILPKA